jgi:hypothetical protein
MKAYEITAIGLRIFAIVLWLFSLRQFVGVMNYLGTNTNDALAPSVFYLVATVLVPIAVGVLVWLFPLSLARSILPGNPDSSLDSLSRSDLYLAAISVLGLFVLSRAVPDLVFWLTRFLVESKMKQQGIVPGSGSETTANFYATLVELGIGTWLVFGSGAIYRFVEKTRKWS